MKSASEATRLILAHRKLLLAYIYSIVRDAHLAEDVLQDSAVVILQRWSEFGEVRNFWALAREVARRQSLAALRKSRKLKVGLSTESLDALDRGFDAVAQAEPDGRVEALRACLQALPEGWRAIALLRYRDGHSLSELAERLERSANGLAVTLNRIRVRLADCVRARLKVEEA